MPATLFVTGKWHTRFSQVCSRNNSTSQQNSSLIHWRRQGRGIGCIHQVFQVPLPVALLQHICSTSEGKATTVQIMRILLITGRCCGLPLGIIKGLSLQEHKWAARVFFKLKHKCHSDKLQKCGKEHLEKIMLTLWQRKTVWPGFATAAIVTKLRRKRFSRSLENDKPCLNLVTLLLLSQQPGWHKHLPNLGAHQMPKIFILLL